LFYNRPPSSLAGIKNKPPRLMAKKKDIKITPAAIRRLQEKFKINNLLGMSESDQEKISLDFFIEFAREGQQHLEEPPSTEEIEEMDFKEIAWIFKDYLADLGKE